MKCEYVLFITYWSFFVLSGVGSCGMGGDVVAFSCCCFARRAGGVCGGLSGVESLWKVKGMRLGKDSFVDMILF